MMKLNKKHIKSTVIKITKYSFMKNRKIKAIYDLNIFFNDSIFIFKNFTLQEIRQFKHNTLPHTWSVKHEATSSGVKYCDHFRTFVPVFEIFELTNIKCLIKY